MAKRLSDRRGAGIQVAVGIGGQQGAQIHAAIEQPSAKAEVGHRVRVQIDESAQGLGWSIGQNGESLVSRE